MIYIGIDPGKETGVAIWISKERILTLTTLPFWKTIDLINEWKLTHKLIIVIEQPGLNSFMYGEKAKYKGTVASTIAQRVGENIAHAKLLIDYCKQFPDNIEVRAVKPKIPKWGKKINEDLFRKVTGYKGKSTPHERDAAHLVYGF